MRKLIIILGLLAMVTAQDSGESYSPVVVYWKTLTPGEKEIFLFSYLTQVYESHSAMKQDLGFNEVTTWYYDNRAEMVYGIFDQLENTEVSEFVGWVDQFYSHPDFQSRPFIEALEFAYRYQEAAGESMWEKYQNMRFDKIEPQGD